MSKTESTEKKTHRNTLYVISGVLVVAQAAAFTMLMETRSDQREIAEDVQHVVSAQSALAEKVSTEQGQASFEERVEEAIESIVARRQAEQQAGPQGAGGPAPTGQPASASGVANGEHGAIYGDPDAPITLYNFADYNCGFCTRFHPEAKAVVDSSDGLVNFVKLNFPVLGAGSNELAQAAECVQQEEDAETFFSFVDALYETKNWPNAAAAIDIDGQSLSACVSEQRYDSIIQDNLAEGQQLGVTGTPATLVVNNRDGNATLLPGYMDRGRLGNAVVEFFNGQGN